MCHRAHMEVRGQVGGVESFLLSCGSEVSNSGSRTSIHVPFCAEPSYRVSDLSILFTEPEDPENQPGFPEVPWSRAADITSCHCRRL